MSTRSTRSTSGRPSDLDHAPAEVAPGNGSDAGVTARDAATPAGAPRPVPRRGVLAGLAAAAATGCSAPGGPDTEPAASGTPATPGTPGTPGPTATVAEPSTETMNSTLVVYFSRAGENYFNGGRIDLEVGNTEVLAGFIADTIPCDVLRLEAAEPYPDDYDDTVQRNAREQDDDARPGIADPPASIEQYDTVLIGSPLWNVRPPLIMATFAQAHDFTGRTVHPFVTYAVSGLGRAERDYADWCAGAEFGEPLAVRGEDVGDARPDAEEWLRGIGLAPPV